MTADATSSTPPSGSLLRERFAAAAYRWPFRRYQSAALEAFEATRARGARSTYLVMPPGSGKTALGLEIGRRLGNPIVALCPNTAVQSQWVTQWRDFTLDSSAIASSDDTTLDAPVTALTYQSVCLFDDEIEALDLENETPPATRQAARDAAADRRAVRSLAARGGSRDELLALLHPNGRDLIERMKARAPLTLILDECHHLLALWGALLGAVIEELGADVFLVGLTATPPIDMEFQEAQIYRRLFGQADFEVATPAVVKEGDLAPYQELAYLTKPMEHEERYIAEQHQRFETLLGRLLAPDFATMDLVTWLNRRVRDRAGTDGARIGWNTFERAEPRLAQAALKFFHELGHPPPDGARYAERHRKPLEADDWIALIEDYAIRSLRESRDPLDEQAWEEIRAALPPLGYALTRRSIRSHRSPVDRVLALSASKGLAAIEILQAEANALGRDMRALVLCDYEVAGAELLERLRGVLDPQAGSAALLLRTLLMSRVTGELDPILMTGRTVACSRSTAVALGDWIERESSDVRGNLDWERLFSGSRESADGWEDVVVVRPRTARWRPRVYVPLITRYLEAGHTRCLIGTRGLLGEGWDCNAVNVLIDLTAATTSTSVHQMRGRSIRLDPARPRKVANNWDVVCVAPNHPRGHGDYGRLIRKHQHYFAPTPEGTIESSVSHLHHELSPYGPPAAADFERLNSEMLARSAQRGDVFRRWRIGEPYENRESRTVRLHFGRSIGVPPRRLMAVPGEPSRTISLGKRLAGSGAAALAAGAAVGVAGAELAGVLVASGGLLGSAGWVSATIARNGRALAPRDTLEAFAAALAEALVETGHLDDEHRIGIAVESDGYYRCRLEGVSLEQSTRFAVALDELLAPLIAPRYIVPLYVINPPRSVFAASRLAFHLMQQPRRGEAVVFHAVPTVLGANKAKAAAFGRAWYRHVSAGDPLFTQSIEGAAILDVQRGADPFAVTSQMRSVWT